MKKEELTMNKKKRLYILTFLISLSSLFISSCPNPFVVQILEPKTVTFDTNGGGSVESQTVFKNYPIKRPSNPSRGGHVFDAWYIDNGTFHKQWDFYTVLTTDITLYANWWVDDTGIIEMGGRPLSDDTVNIRNGGSVTFSVVSGYTDYNWTLNGTDAGTGRSYTFDTSDNKELGRNYIIGLRVQKDGKYYLAQVTVRIMDAEIAVKTQPARLTYSHGDTLNLSGLAVTLTYDDSTTEDVALNGFASKNISVSPADSSVLSYSEHDNQPVIVSYGGKTTETDRLTVAKVEQQAGDNNIVNYWVDDTGDISIGTGEQVILNNTVTIRNGGSVTFSAIGDYTDHNWTLNGAGVGTDASYTFDTSDNDKEPGRNYIIGLRVIKDDKYYFTYITVRIEE